MIKKLLFLFLCFLLLNASNDNILINVEFFQQKNYYDCGVVALMSILKWKGYTYDYDFIKKEIYSESAKGTFPFSIEIFLRKYKINYIIKQGSLSLIKNLLEKQIPQLALIKKKILLQEINHYYVIVGIKKEKIIAHTGTKAFQSIEINEFLKNWEKSNYWLLYLPK